MRLVVNHFWRLKKIEEKNCFRLLYENLSSKIRAINRQNRDNV